MKFRTIELRDAAGDLVCQEPIHQPIDDKIHRFVIFNGTRLFKYDYRFLAFADDSEVAVYREEPDLLRCGRAVITDGQIEGVGVERIVEAVTHCSTCGGDGVFVSPDSFEGVGDCIACGGSGVEAVKGGRDD